MSNDLLATELRQCEKELGLPPEFLDKLLLEDDWSFVIKAHALVEGAISHLLTHEVDRRLSPVFERLELSGAGVGKAAFAAHLELINSGQKSFIRRFSELRNKLVHDVTQVSFRFEDYIAGLDKNQRKALAEAVAGGVGEASTDGVLERQYREDPKTAIWIVVVLLLTNTLSKARHAKAIRALTGTSPSGLAH